MSYAFRILLAFLLVSRLSFAADGPTNEQVEFFEKEVRPLLVQHCHECHGAKKQEAALRLDTHAGLLKGSDSGPVVIPGNIEGSRLLQALLYTDGGTQMPPKGKLPEPQIAVIRKWLELGAPWPAESAPLTTQETAKNHWAFQPIKHSLIPHVTSSSTSECRTPVDSFIAAALAKKNLALSNAADRYTLIRRMTFDLWGIPPTYERVQEFLAETSPDAVERLIDELLASPRYGQRWGRHWLDIARYADSKGYVFTAEPRYPYSYTYRDYVVDAFNSDLPFDRFVIEQLAADLVIEAEKGAAGNSETHDPRLAALGFLTVGQRFSNNTQEIIDDRIDVVSRGFLGLTVGCARCHDHKYDPIPTDDYYSLYGVFSSTIEPEELPIIGAPKSREAYEKFLAELANREAAVVTYEKDSVPKLMDEIRTVVGDSIQQIARQLPIWAETPVAFQGSNEPRAPLVQRWKDFLTRMAAQPNAVFGVWNSLSQVAKVEDFVPEVTKLIETWSKPDQVTNVNSLVRQAIIDQKPTSLVGVGQIYGNLFSDVQKQWIELKKTMPEAVRLPDDSAEELRQVLYGDSSPSNVTFDEARSLFAQDIRNMVTNLKRKADNLRVTDPGAPPRAMVVRDGPIHEPVVFIRGNAGRPGKPVPRQFLGVAAGAERKPFTRGSGRLELAQSIVDSKNPLSARIIVNRIWQHHFGSGIVPTPSDFGIRGLPPSHPELLDWLASEMSQTDVSTTAVPSPERWSIKRMHRLMLASAVYRQSSEEIPAARKIDPENRLLWRMPRQRLDFEAMRDSLLAVSGRLDETLGGQPFEGVMNPASTRRTIYAFINRNDLPGVFRAFDFADTDSSAAERPQTTVPQQSLFAMNSPFVQELAHHFATECEQASPADLERLDILYRRTFSRKPTAVEQRQAITFLKSAEISATEKTSPWDRLVQVLLMTNEFSFVD